RGLVPERLVGVGFGRPPFSSTRRKMVNVVGLRVFLRRHTRRNLLLLGALSLAAQQTSAWAQTPPASVANGGLVRLASSYNGRTAQSMGQIVEYKAAQAADKRGLTGAAREAFIASSLAAGGAGLAAASQTNAAK